MSLGIRTGGLSTQSFSWLAKKHHLTEEEVRDLDSRYKNSDLDRSGQLDKDELKILLKATIAKSASEAGLTKFLDSQWHNVDRDGNGTVDFDEFLNLYAVLKNSEIFAAKPKAAAAGQPAEAAKPAAATAKPAAAGKGKEKKGKTASGANLGVEKKQKTKTKRAKKATFQPSAALTKQNYVTNEIVWATIRNHNAFLIKRGNGRNVLSSERGNLRNIHSRRTSGLIRNRPIDVSILDGGAINLRVNAPSARRRNQPARRNVDIKLAGNSNRKLAQALKKQLANNKGAHRSVLARMSRLRDAAPGAHQTRKRNRRGNNPQSGSAASAAQPAAQTTAPTTTAQ